MINVFNGIMATNWLGWLKLFAGINHFHALHHINGIEYKLGTWYATCGIIGLHIVAQGATTNMICGRDGQAKLLTTTAQWTGTGVGARLGICIEHLHALNAL